MRRANPKSMGCPGFEAQIRHLVRFHCRRNIQLAGQIHGNEFAARKVEFDRAAAQCVINLKLSRLFGLPGGARGHARSACRRRHFVRLIHADEAVLAIHSNRRDLTVFDRRNPFERKSIMQLRPAEALNFFRSDDIPGFSDVNGFRG